MILSVPLSDGSMSVLSDPPRQYYRVRADWEFGDMRSAAPCPAIVNPFNSGRAIERNPLTAEWQWFWFGLNRTGNGFEYDAQKWRTYANRKSCITDGYGVDNCRDEISGRNLELSQFPLIEAKLWEFGVVCVIGNPVKLWMREWYSQIETLDIRKPPPFEMTYLSHPHLIQKASVLTLKGDGRCGYQINPFPHFGGRTTGISVYCPLVAKNPVYYKTELLEALPIGNAIPNAYNPPMD